MHVRGNLLRVAVADGASNAYESGRWARLLVDWWVHGSASTGRQRSRHRQLCELGEAWRHASLPTEGAPWYVAEKARRGSYATFLGATIKRQGNRWLVTVGATGDTNVFVIRSGALVRAFPLVSSADFGEFPALMGTAKSTDAASWRWLHCRPRPGDTIFVATDALAEHLLNAEESGTPLWRSVRRAAARRATFDSWVDEHRRSGLKDDDATLLLVELG
jgi:hypothetical protein